MFAFHFLPQQYKIYTKKNNNVRARLFVCIIIISDVCGNPQVQSSNASRIVLNNVVPEISGKFSCEVSADAPSFQTHIVSGELQVVGGYDCTTFRVEQKEINQKSNFFPPNFFLNI